jgi:hypothetical protein
MRNHLMMVAFMAGAVRAMNLAVLVASGVPVVALDTKTILLFRPERHIRWWLVLGTQAVPDGPAETVLFVLFGLA